MELLKEYGNSFYNKGHVLLHKGFFCFDIYTDASPNDKQSYGRRRDKSLTAGVITYTVWLLTLFVKGKSSRIWANTSWFQSLHIHTNLINRLYSQLFEQVESFWIFNSFGNKFSVSHWWKIKVGEKSYCYLKT